MTSDDKNLDTWLGRARDQYRYRTAPAALHSNTLAQTMPRTNRKLWWLSVPIGAALLAAVVLQQPAMLPPDQGQPQRLPSLTLALPDRPTIVAPSLSGARSVALPSVPVRAPKPSRDPAATTTQQQRLTEEKIT